jgi:hypothetical protein
MTFKKIAMMRIVTGVNFNRKKGTRVFLIYPKWVPQKDYTSHLLSVVSGEAFEKQVSADNSFQN